MGTGQQGGTCPHSRAPLTPAPPLPFPLVGALWGFGILCSLWPACFSKLACGTLFRIYPFIEDQKLVWRRLPCLAPLPL